MNLFQNITALFCIVCSCTNGIAQQTAVRPDLSPSTRLTPVNREITIAMGENKKTVVHLDSKPGSGLAWINDLDFKTGIVELDIKGKNIQQQSFVGLAYHGLNDSTYDAVYLRPFNFESPDTSRKNHSVQYISLPGNDWPVLREKYPGKYENKLTKSIDPEGWFHVKIEISQTEIRVYVNGETKASLQVTAISKRSTGKVGFWVGNNSDGDFSNLSVLASKL